MPKNSFKKGLLFQKYLEILLETKFLTEWHELKLLV